MKELISIIAICLSWAALAQNYTVTGIIKDKLSGEPIPFARIEIIETGQKTNSNLDGKYSLKVNEGSQTVQVSFFGYVNIVQTITVSSDLSLDIILNPANVQLEQVEISAEKLDDNIKSTEMGTSEIDVEEIKKVPALLGEADPIKVLQLTPGVQNAGEGTGGFFVRGGDNSQNLVLFDNIPIYNADHLFGFFSVFNVDAIDQVKLFKSAIPANYGGRLSSLLDVSMIEGNPDSLQGNFSIGSVSSKLTLHGPIKKDKLNFVVSARRTYGDMLLQLIPDQGDDRIFFHDINTKLSYRLNPSNQLTLSTYYGKDVFRFGNEFEMGWSNNGGNIEWQHTYSDKLFGSLNAGVSDYRYFLRVPQGPDQFDWKAGIRELNIRKDFTYYRDTNSTFSWGLGTAYRTIDQGTITVNENESVFNNIQSGEDHSFEHFAFVAHKWHINSKLSLDYGFRLSLYQKVGRDTTYDYNGEDVIGQTAYNSMEVIRSFNGLEPRIALKYQVDSVSAVKSSYTRTKQYIHLVSNSTASSPFDIWITSDVNLEPQISNQFSVGYYRNFKENLFEASMELYYKNMQNQIDFKENEQLLLNKHIDNAVLPGIGWAYGSEFMLRKKRGNLTGWVSYTLSRVQRRIEGINNDQPYSPLFDKTHDVSVVAMYELNDKWSFGSNWVYSTGAAVTLPVGQFNWQDYQAPLFSERNGARLPAYHRLDLSATRHKKSPKWFKKAETDLIFSVYNTYFRKNTFSVYFRENEDTNQQEAVKVYLFGIIPSITYNINF